MSFKVEQLEQRNMLAGWASPNVTISFHPSAYALLDPAGAAVLAGQGDEDGNQLVDIFDVAAVSQRWNDPGYDIFAVAAISNNWGRTASDVWQDEFRAAWSLWDDACGISFREVPDDGSPMGTLGMPQGDPQFGDIRIGAADLSSIGSGLIAYTTFPTAVGTLGGDVRLDLDGKFSCDPSLPGVDLQSVAIHELGHALGFDHQGVDSVMFDRYRFYRELTPQDQLDAVAKYGPDAADAALADWV